MKRIKNIFAILLFALAMPSCDDNDELSPGSIEPPMETESHPARAIELTESQQDITKSLRIFSWEMLEAISEQQRERNENLIFSPLSLDINLAMLLNGLQGETKQGMLEMMHLSAYDTEEINQYFKALSEGIEDADNVTRFVTSNSLWYDKRYMPESDVEHSLSENYGCEFYPVVYGNETTVKINKWAEDRTYGRIKHIVDKTIHNVDFYHLINAVYFRSPWSDKMTECGIKSFTQKDNTTVQVEMITNTITDGFYESTSQYEATMLPFSNKAFGMFFILPKQDVSFSDVYKELKTSGHTFAQMPQQSKVIVTIPKFEVESRLSLIEPILALGGEELLASPVVNILAGKSEILPAIQQAANIKVNEEGAEAAAVTVILDGATGESYKPISITFDRPFIYGIVERSTGMPLFMGEVTKLNSYK